MDKRNLYQLLAGIVAVCAIGATSMGCVDAPSGSSDIGDGSGNRQDVVQSGEDFSCEIVSVNNYVLTDSIGTKYLIGSVCVKNTGTVNAYLSSGTFDIEDASGALIDSQSYISAYPEIIAPGETAVYFDAISFDNGSANGEYSIVPTIDAESSEVDLIRCPVTDISFTDGKFGGIEVVGRVENTTSEEQSLLNVAIILYGKDDKVLSVIHTYPDDVAPGAKIGFSGSTLFQDELKVSDIASYEAYAYPTQFNF